MFNTMKKTIALLAVWCSVLTTYGQEQPAVLTFRDAVKIGLKNNVELNQQKNQLEYTGLNKTSTMLQLGPTVQAQASASRLDGNSFNNQTGDVVNGIRDNINGSISASMPLFNGLSQVNQYRQAKNSNEAQLHFVNRTSQTVIRDVSSQFLTCLLDEQIVKINEENVVTQQVQYNQIKEQVDLGSKAEADLYNQEYQLKNAELLLVRARNTFKNDLATLCLTLQLDPSVPFELEPLTWDINALLQDSVTLEEMYATALTRRSDLKQADHAEKAFRFAYSSYKGRYYPSLYAGASYGSQYNYIKDGDNSRTFREQFTKDNRQLNYGLTLNIPIYNGLQYRAQAASVKVTHENAKLAQKNTEVTIKSDVLRAYQNFSDAKTSYNTSQAQLKAAELSYTMEKERYALGISDIVQLTISNQAYVKAKGDFQSSLYTLMFQRLLIDYAMGTLKFEDIP
jgi:outer membrane protein